MPLSPAVEEDRQQALALQRRHRLATVGLRIFTPCRVNTCRHHVDDMPDLVRDRPTLLHHRRPARDKRCRDPALVHPVLVPPEWCIARIRPRQPIAHVRIDPARRQPVLAIVETRRTAFRAAPVVRQEHHQRVVPLPQRLDLPEHPSDAGVHPFDLRRVDRHLQVHQLLVFLLLPGPGLLITRRYRPVFANQTHLDHALPSLFAQPIPALTIFALVFRDILGPGVQGPVRRGVGQIEKEGLVVLSRFVEKLHCMVGEGVGHVEAVFGWLIGPIVNCHLSGNTLGLGLAGVEVAIESPIGRPVRTLLAHVPLARHQRAIARRLQCLGNRDALLVQIALIGGITLVAHHEPDARLVGVQPRQQRCPRRAAASAVVELREANALGREAVEMGGMDLPTIAADVGVAHIVGHDQHDVGLAARARRRGRLCRGQASTQGHRHRARADRSQEFTSSTSQCVHRPASKRPTCTSRQRRSAPSPALHASYLQPWRSPAGRGPSSAPWC